MEPGQKPWPRVAGYTERLKCQEKLIFVFAFLYLFFHPSGIKGLPGRQTELRCCNSVSQAVFCLGGFLFGKQRAVYWALQQHYRKANPSSPVSTGSQHTKGKKRKCQPRLLQITSTTPNKSLLKPPQPVRGYLHREKNHNGRGNNSEWVHSRGKSRGRPNLHDAEGPPTPVLGIHTCQV